MITVERALLEQVVNGSPGERWDAICKIAEILAQPPEERNFCPRCGKRHGAGIHTCTPPGDLT